MNWPFDPLTPLKYGAILADPPWSFAMRSEKGHAKSPEAHYATMDIETIKALPVLHLASGDCMLFLWSTWPHLPQALAVMADWGFRYVTGGSWTKRTPMARAAFGTGYVMRSSTEPYLIGALGAPKIRSRSVRNLIEAPEQFPDGIESLRREHSRKPPEMREAIEALLPDTFACELFAREPWAGNDVWGLEADKFQADADQPGRRAC